MGNTFTPQVTHGIDPFDVAAFFVRADQERSDPDVTPMKLHKLLYLAQANYLASTGFRLFDAPMEAWEHGPVVDSLRPEFVGGQIIVPQEHPTVVHRTVPEDVDAFLSRIWELYGDWSASQLRRLTHAQAPWRDHYREGVMHAPIPDESMAAYFRNEVDLKNRVFHPDVVVVDRSFLDDLDDREDEIVAQLTNALS